jgi:PAS domain S-box-containing protein
MKMMPDQEAGEPFRILYQLLASLSKAKRLPEVYSAALSSLTEATGANRAAILFFDDDGVMRFHAARGLSAEYQAAVTGHTPWRRGETGAQPIVVPDVLKDADMAPFRDAFGRENIRSLAFVPLVLDDGVFGKFMLYYAAPHRYTADEIQIAQAIAAHVALATQQKQAEMARARSEQRLQAILENSATVIFLKSLDGRYLLVNRRWEELVHTAADRVIGRTDADIFPPETAAQLRANDLAVLSAGKSISVEETVRLDDGVHTFVVVKFPMRDSDGAVSGVYGIATDITERKQLEASSQRLAAIIESSEDAVASKDLNGLVTSWNRGAERIFGYRADEILGKPISILAAPERADEMPAILAKIRRGERVDHFETRRRRKDGRIIDVSLTISPVRDEDGRVVGASKIARDISERKAAERERAELLAREQTLNQVGPRLAAQLDLQKLAQEVTDIATRLIGAEFGAFFHNVTNGKGEPCTLHSIAGVLPETLANFTPRLDRNRLVRVDDLAAETGGVRSTPSIRSYLSAPVIARSKEVLGGLFFGHSEPGKFTENHEAIVAGIAAQAGIAMDNARLFEQAQWVQSELKRSNEELRRANRDLEVFAYSASHDLQEPLRTVAISAQLIERGAGNRLEPDESAFLKEIQAAARRMSGLINDLLEYTRAAKYEEGAPPRVEAGQVLQRVLKDLGGAIQETAANVVVGDLPAVAMHENRLAQVFQNLIANALKYRGKEVPCVRVTAEERGGWMVFSVTDNGIGIEPQYAEQIFGLFKRLHPRSEFAGNGIGLAVCQRVVEQYGGRIWLDRSAIGEGSTFCFSIPARS